MPIFSEIEEGRAEASIVKNETSDIENISSSLMLLIWLLGDGYHLQKNKNFTPVTMYFDKF
jgi:hypothetical protein